MVFRVGLEMRDPSGLLLMALTFGMVILGDTPTVANNLLYVLINFVLLYGRAKQLLGGSDQAEEITALSVVIRTLNGNITRLSKNDKKSKDSRLRGQSARACA
jgi:hypothetical protein